MSNGKPTKPKGTRDFGPAQMAKRMYLLDTIRQVFAKYGFLPLETPAMENLSVLTGKYGDEGDQLLFKILNSGDFLSKVEGNIGDFDARSLLPRIAEKGLRYDLTVPFARYVVMNRNDLTLPFKRYQVQPVWRADRPQKGRYREFLQCDADVIGTKSLLCEAEIIMMLNEIFAKLGLDGYQIVINNRKFLTGLSTYLDQPNRENELCVAIDKLDKIGQEKVYQELADKGFGKEALARLTQVLQVTGSHEEKLSKLRQLLAGTPAALAGLSEVQELLNLVKGMEGNLTTVNFDPALARGLSYYTGIIFEVRLLDGSIGSICGGGRYDDLTGIFGMPDMPGTGISLGIDRIYDVMAARGLFPKQLATGTQALVINFGAENQAFALAAIARLRANNISSELYPDNAKMKKQLTYANRNNIRLVIIAGSEEVAANQVAIKDMRTGTQQTVPAAELIATVNKILDSN